MSYDPAVLCSVTATMAALQRHVSRASFFYVTGETDSSKILALAARFDERYRLVQTIGQRDHARRRGEGTFRFVIWPLTGKTSLRWWLLRTDADHPFLGLEKWRDARQHRIVWPWLYELVRTPVPPRLRSKYRRRDGTHAINSQTWTWRIRRDELKALRASIRHWSQYNDDRLPALVRSLHKGPGFRGVREDSLGLYHYIVRQHAKRGRPAPFIPQTQPWVSGKTAGSIPLSTLVRRQARGAQAWFPTRMTRRDTASAPPETESENASEKGT